MFVILVFVKVKSSVSQKNGLFHQSIEIIFSKYFNYEITNSPSLQDQPRIIFSIQPEETIFR